MASALQLSISRLARELGALQHADNRKFSKTGKHLTHAEQEKIKKNPTTSKKK